MDISLILQTLVAMGLSTLRQQLVLARLANRQYEQKISGATKGTTVNIVVPSAITAVNVTPAAVPPSTASTTPSVVPIQLSEWKEAPFYLTDYDLARIADGIVPMQAAEAVKAIANAIETFLWTKANFFGYAGSAGTTPFATDLSAYLSARAIANRQLMPMDNRYVVIDPNAEANALGLRAFQDASFRGDTAGIVNGQIGQKLGALWAMSQLVPTQSPGAPSAYQTAGAHSAGVKTIAVDTGAGAINAGAVFTIAGDTQTYSVQSTVGGGVVTSITFEPALATSPADNTLLTFKSAFVKNLLFHRDALGFVMAPLMDTVVSDKLVEMATIIDEESGLSLRLEITREHKRWRWSFDAMYGGAMVRPEFGVIIAG